MNAEISQLESHLDLLAQIISHRQDGNRYVPIYLRVEAELTACRNRSSLIDRIHARAVSQSTAKIDQMRVAA